MVGCFVGGSMGMGVGFLEGFRVGFCVVGSFVGVSFGVLEGFKENWFAGG